MARKPVVGNLQSDVTQLINDLSSMLSGPTPQGNALQQDIQTIGTDVHQIATDIVGILEHPPQPL